MAIAAIEEKDLFELETFGVTDSKAFSPVQRRELAEMVRRVCEVEVEIATPEQIDEALTHPSRNLNILEAEMAGRLIDRLVERLGALKIKKVILDCPSSNAKAYVKDMQHRVKRDVLLEAEHKADQKYRIVGAASILAKVIRDEEIEALKREHGVDFGSGYPSDAKTARFVREHHADYDFFRKTWEPYRRAASGKEQQSLGRFGVDISLPPAVKKKQDKLLELLEEGFVRAEAKGVAEVLRLRREGVTITLYANGKVLVQGKEKEEWERRLS
ncbi:ribonuclease HII [Candidatus Woesearchaeota archaeon]|nr:ribonuclease HII [Candidatus Woesearchaeota archaeon]